MRPEITVCVATHRRPEGLARLLASLAVQDAGVPFETIVVDNSPEGSAEADLAPGPRPPALQFLHEPVENVARARNRAVEAAAGAWLAFIDDDEEAAPDWLAQHWRAARTRRADGWFGPVLPELERVVTPWLDPERFYSRPRHRTGTFVPASELRAGNAFLRRSALGGARFDPAFGTEGGEDCELFGRLQAQGRFFAWCDEAVVVERVPAERHRLGWLLGRSFRGGLLASRLAARRQGDSSRRRLSRACLALAALCTALPVAALFGRPAALRLALRASVQMGHLRAEAERWDGEALAPATD